MDTTSGKTVLVAESDEHVRAMLYSMLQRNGYHAIQAANVDRAREICAQTLRLDLLVTSEPIGRMNASDLVMSLLPLHPEMRVLCLAAQRDSSLGDLAREGRVAFLDKPLTLTAFLQSVRVLLPA